MTMFFLARCMASVALSVATGAVFETRTEVPNRLLDVATGWQLPASVTKWMREELIPSRYLASVAQKTLTAAERQRLRMRAEEILARVRSPDGPLCRWDDEQRIALEAKARQCAELFQPSSSYVEGRNGALSMRHHGCIGLRPGNSGP